MVGGAFFYRSNLAGGGISSHFPFVLSLAIASRRRCGSGIGVIPFLNFEKRGRFVSWFLGTWIFKYLFFLRKVAPYEEKVVPNDIGRREKSMRMRFSPYPWTFRG